MIYVCMYLSLFLSLYIYNQQPKGNNSAWALTEKDTTSKLNSNIPVCKWMIWHDKSGSRTMRLRVPHPSPADYICKLFPLSNRTSTIILYPATTRPSISIPLHHPTFKIMGAGGIPVSWGIFILWIQFSPKLLSSNRAPNFLSFKGVPSPLPRFFRGYFHPLFINLKGITACSKLLNFNNTWVQQNHVLSVVSGF